MGENGEGGDGGEGAATSRGRADRGLVGIGTSGRIVVCKRAGLRAVCHEELPTPRPSPATLIHSAVTVTVAARLEREGNRVLSEREIAAAERAAGKRIYSAERGERFHLRDILRRGDG